MNEYMYAIMKVFMYEMYVNIKQAGTVLGQAQLKLEIELWFTKFKICCIKLIQLVKLDLVW